MTEDKKAEDQQPHIDTIASLMRKRKPKPIEEQQSVDSLYETMTVVVSDLDTSIRDCKKYNQAKIHRKYEIIIADLRERIKFLEQKIKEEHRARSPSKKYVEDLLDKLVNYRFRNEELSKRIQQLTAQNSEIKAKIKIYEQDLAEGDHKKEDEKSIKKQIRESESTMYEITGPALSHEVNAFLKLKQSLRRHENLQKSSFERFLKKVQDKFINWTMRNFLQAIEKWTHDYYESDLHKNRSGKSNEASKTIFKPPLKSFRLRNHANTNSSHLTSLSINKNVLR